VGIAGHRRAEELVPGPFAQRSPTAVLDLEQRFSVGIHGFELPPDPRDKQCWSLRCCRSREAHRFVGDDEIAPG
jgi:hypothetical protein